MTVYLSRPGVNLKDKLQELDLKKGIAGRELISLDSFYNQADLLGSSVQNLCVNGSMQIWQRGTYTTSSTTGYRTADRWYHYSSGTYMNGSGVERRSTDAPKGFEYSLEIESGATYTGGNYAMLRYGIEPSDCYAFNGRGFTVQFWVKATNPGTYTLMALHHNSTTQRQLSKTYTINESGVWEFKVITFPWDIILEFGSITQFLSLDWFMGRNTNYSGGTFNGDSWENNTSNNRVPTYQQNAFRTSGDKFNITGVQIVPGQYPHGLPFQHRTFAEELMLCQRYYEVIADSNVVGSAVLGMSGQHWNSTTSIWNLQFKVPKRTEGSYSLEAPSTANWLRIYGPGNNTTGSTFTLDVDSHSRAARINSFTNSGWTPGDALWARFNVSNLKVAIDDELF